MPTGLHCVRGIAFYAVTNINVTFLRGAGGLQRTARLIAAVIVAVVAVHVPLPQLPARLVLLAAAAVAVSVVDGGRGPLALLLVVLVVLVVTVLPGAAVRLPVDEPHFPLGVVRSV